MVTKRSVLSSFATAGLAAVLVACSGGSGDSGSAGSSPSATTTSTPASTTPAPTTPSAKPPLSRPTPSAPAPAKARTKAELTKALLALDDLPAGFSIDPDDADDGSRIVSKEARCAGMIALFNSLNIPGAKASAYRLYTGGQEGPYFQESLDAMGPPAATTALLTKARAAIRSCPRAKFRMTGVGASTIRISEVSAPKVGTSPVSFRMAADSGPLAGFEAYFVATGLDDVVLGMVFDGGMDLEEPVAEAYAKASTVLGTGKTAT